MVKFEELKIQLCFYSWFMIILLPKHISAPMMLSAHPVYFYA